MPPQGWLLKPQEFPGEQGQDMHSACSWAQRLPLGPHWSWGPHFNIAIKKLLGRSLGAHGKLHLSLLFVTLMRPVTAWGDDRPKGWSLKVQQISQDFSKTEKGLGERCAQCLYLQDKKQPWIVPAPSFGPALWVPPRQVLLQTLAVGCPIFLGECWAKMSVMEIHQVSLTWENHHFQQNNLSQYKWHAIVFLCTSQECTLNCSEEK
jgi:hypothetical protein